MRAVKYLRLEPMQLPFQRIKRNIFILFFLIYILFHSLISYKKEFKGRKSEEGDLQGIKGLVYSKEKYHIKTI